jgi:hypothetical protein
MALSPNEMREKIRAVVIAQATPLSRDGSLDLNGLKTNTEYLLERLPALRTRDSILPP